MSKKYTFICEDDEDGAVFTATQKREDLHLLLEDFQNFLRGCGFYFDGVIDINTAEEGSTYEPDETPKEKDDYFVRTPEGYIVSKDPFNFSRDLPNRNPKE
ncbi:hypothetical protein UFOVP58_200 [uncultured Caudovirales phage]|uniref:Uncharacterized protein n=1 Tax=uncultured Caudovirales phage TaxID=2100421 RepID=A0A6J5KT96_9CAUD|nr:hypothetical protein UFOVP58_200 [uncultured Caudovirales phage]